MKKRKKICLLVILVSLLLCLTGCSEKQEEEKRPAVMPKKPFKVFSCFKEALRIKEQIILSVQKDLIPDQVDWGIYLSNPVDEMMLSHGEVTVLIKSESLKEEILQKLKGIPLYKEPAFMGGAGFPATVLSVVCGGRNIVFEEFIISLDIRIDEINASYQPFGYYLPETSLDQAEEVLFPIYSKLTAPFQIRAGDSMWDLVILYVETEEFIIQGDPDKISYPDLMPVYWEVQNFDFKSYGFTAYENNQEIEVLSETAGEHFVLLKNGKTEYLLRYRCE